MGALAVSPAYPDLRRDGRPLADEGDPAFRQQREIGRQHRQLRETLDRSGGRHPDEAVGESLLNEQDEGAVTVPEVRLDDAIESLRGQVAGPARAPGAGCAGAFAAGKVEQIEIVRLRSVDARADEGGGAPIGRYLESRDRPCGGGEGGQRPAAGIDQDDARRPAIAVGAVARQEQEPISPGQPLELGDFPVRGRQRPGRSGLWIGDEESAGLVVLVDHMRVVLLFLAPLLEIALLLFPDEGDSGSVRSPGRRLVGDLFVGDLFRFAAVRRHQVELRRVPPIRDERQAPAVRRPARRPFRFLRVGELPGGARLDIQHPDVAAVPLALGRFGDGPGDPPAVGAGLQIGQGAAGEKTPRIEKGLRPAPAGRRHRQKHDAERAAEESSQRCRSRVTSSRWWCRS